MISTIKTYLGIAMAATTGILFALFKYKSGQLDMAEKRIKEQEQKLRTEEAKRVADHKVKANYKAEMKEIGDYYDKETIRQFEDYDDKPLSPSLLERLRNKEGTGGNTDTPPS